jgi:F-type H+-transporting ATPase subunit b
MELVTPGIGLLFWMLLSFTILLLLLKKFAWKPILNALKDREKSIEEALHAAEKTKEETLRIQQSNEQLLQESMNQRIEMLKEARKLEDSILSEAKKEADISAKRIMDEAKIHIENEKKAAIEEIKNIVADLSVVIAEKLIKQHLANDKNQKELINGLLKDLKIN